MQFSWIGHFFEVKLNIVKPLTYFQRKFYFCLFFLCEYWLTANLKKPKIFPTFICTKLIKSLKKYRPTRRPILERKQSPLSRTYKFILVGYKKPVYNDFCFLFLLIFCGVPCFNSHSSKLHLYLHGKNVTKAKCAFYHIDVLPCGRAEGIMMQPRDDYNRNKKRSIM